MNKVIDEKQWKVLSAKLENKDSAYSDYWRRK